MSKREKLRQKLRNNPVGATMQEVETLLKRFGFLLLRVSGSHHVYRYDDGQHIRNIVVPLHSRKVRTVYVREVIQMLDELFPEDVDEDDEDDEE